MVTLPMFTKEAAKADVRGSRWFFRGQELCESRGGRSGLPSLISLRFLWT